MIFKYILNFFLRNNYGHFRTVFIVPFIGVFLGSLIIFLTYSIMNSLEYEMQKRVNSFKYKYNLCDENFNDVFDYDNKGAQKISFIKNKKHESVIELYLFDDYIGYKDKISDFIRKDLETEGIIIGDDLADFLNVQAGDSVELFLPADLNVSASLIPSSFYEVSTIYNFDLFDYDSRYAFIPKNIVYDILLYDEVCYYADTVINANLIKENSLLLEAINLEKNLYTTLSFMVIFICCIIIFNIMSMVMIDKQHQFYYMNILGFDNCKFYSILIFFNSFLSLSSTFGGLLIANLILYLNYNFNLFSFVFESLPFKIVPFTVALIDYLALYFLINFLIIFFSTLPYKIVRK